MGNYNLRDNYTIQKEYIIQKQSSDLFFGNYTIFSKSNQNQYLLRIDTYANSKEKLEEIIFSIDKQKKKSQSNIIHAKDIANNNKITCNQGYNISLYYNYFKITLMDEIKTKRKKNQLISQSQIWFILNEISRALVAMKDKQIAHWNVKPQHIFKDENDNYFLYDSSYFIDHRNPIHFIEKKINHKCCYVSPQLYKYIKESTLIQYDVGFQNDIYNLGQTLLILMTLKDPISYYKNGRIDENQTYNQIRRCNGVYSLNLTFLVMKMFETVQQRLKIEELRKLLKPIEDKIVRNLEFYKNYKIWEYLDQQRGSSYRSSIKSTHKQIRESPNVNLNQLKKFQVQLNQMTLRSNKISLGKSNSVFYSPRSKNNNQPTLQKLMRRQSNQVYNTIMTFPQINESKQPPNIYESDNKIYFKPKKNQ